MTEQHIEVEVAATPAKTRIEIPTEKYVKSKSAGGSATQHNGDVVATSLAGQPIDVVFAVAAAMLTGVTAEDLQAKYAHLNVGQQRMNLGNRIRGAVNKMDKAVDAKVEGAIGGAQYLATIMTEYPLPEPEPAAEVTVTVESADEAE